MILINNVYCLILRKKSAQGRESAIVENIRQEIVHRKWSQCYVWFTMYRRTPVNQGLLSLSADI